MPERTTLTLDDDVAARLRDRARRLDQPFKDVVNEALRTGLDREEETANGPYQTPARDLGLREGVDLDDIQGLLDRLDGPERR